jgi:serine/threonine protein kinase
LGGNATMPGEMVGTLYYMSPEQIMGHPCDGRTDVYSVGITLYEKLTGQVPFPNISEASFGTLVNHLSTPPVPPSVRNSAIPEELDEVVLSALAKDPAQRPTVIEFADNLIEVSRRVLGDDTVDKLFAHAASRSQD